MARRLSGAGKRNDVSARENASVVLSPPNTHQLVAKASRPMVAITAQRSLRPVPIDRGSLPGLWTRKNQKYAAPITAEIAYRGFRARRMRVHILFLSVCQVRYEKASSVSSISARLRPAERDRRR